ncbi:hypothetical protein [Paenibacillus chitinolyticus]|uniref:hypothetical protein n=1 Tax=Paenibacillus chitinolyticus TaxID=79263 RepID=UPI00210D01C6|nr:hypothetical protein [Paenibacillus chitinolyticus]
MNQVHTPIQGRVRALRRLGLPLTYSLKQSAGSGKSTVSADGIWIYALSQTLREWISSRLSSPTSAGTVPKPLFLLLWNRWSRKRGGGVPRTRRSLQGDDEFVLFFAQSGEWTEAVIWFML